MASTGKRVALVLVGALLGAVVTLGVVRLNDDPDERSGGDEPTSTTPSSTSADPPPPEVTAPVSTGPQVAVGDGTALTPYEWRPVRLGGGGNISGISAAADGALLARSDTYGAYLRPAGATEWRQLLTTSAVPAQFHVPKLGKGAQAVAIAPSDSSRLYVLWAGHLLSSLDGGATFSTTAFEPANSDANANFGKGFGDKVAVDPVAPDRVLASGPDTPLRLSTDGGATWSEPGVPAGLPQARISEDYGGEILSVGITGLAYDPNSSTVGGVTSVVYAASWGNGVFRSTDAGATWTAIGGPVFVHHATVDAAGRYYVTSGDREGPFTVQRFDGAGWTEITPGDWEPGGIAAVENPFIAARPDLDGTVVLGYANDLFVTRDGGESWDRLTWRDGTGDVTWAQSDDEDYYLVASDLVFDPARPDRMWLTTGEGTQYATLPDDGNSIEWIEATRGIENMVTTDIASLRNAPPVFGVYDFGQFSGSSSFDDFSLRKGPVDFFSGTTSLAASPFADGFAVSVTTDYVTEEPPLSSSYTEDGGLTWVRFPTMPKGAESATQFGYGSIAVSTPDNIVWAPGSYYATETDDFQPYYTLDRGVTWSPVELPGVTSYPSGSVGGFMFGRNRQAVVADEVTPGVFYLTMVGEGLFRSTDGGVTWERRHDGDFALGDPTYSALLGAMPGREGELFYTDGPVGGHDFLGPQEHGGSAFLRSRDGGATWEPVPGVDKVLSFGFGAGAPGAAVGAIYLAGDVAGEYGIWQSLDDAATWNRIADFPYSVDWVGVVAGDRNEFGIVYVGMSGSSFIYGRPV